METKLWTLSRETYSQALAASTAHIQANFNAKSRKFEGKLKYVLKLSLVISFTSLGLLIIRLKTLKHYAIKSNLNSCFFQTSSQSSWLIPREISTLCSRKPTGFYTKETRTSLRTSSKTWNLTTRMEMLIWKLPCKSSSASCIRGCLVFSILNTALIASK